MPRPSFPKTNKQTNKSRVVVVPRRSLSSGAAGFSSFLRVRTTERRREQVEGGGLLRLAREGGGVVEDEEEESLWPQPQVSPFPCQAGLGSLLTPGATLLSAGLASALEPRFISPRFRGGEGSHYFSATLPPHFLSLLVKLFHAGGKVSYTTHARANTHTDAPLAAAGKRCHTSARLLP